MVYWYWRDPRDGKEKPLQCPDDKSLAIKRASQLNALIARELADTIVSAIVATPKTTKPVAGMPFERSKAMIAERVCGP